MIMDISESPKLNILHSYTIQKRNSKTCQIVSNLKPSIKYKIRSFNGRNIVFDDGDGQGSYNTVIRKFYECPIFQNPPETLKSLSVKEYE